MCFTVNGSESESGFTRGCLDYSQVQHPDREPKPEGSKSEVCREYSISGGIAKVREHEFLKEHGAAITVMFNLGVYLPLQLF